MVDHPDSEGFDPAADELAHGSVDTGDLITVREGLRHLRREVNTWFGRIDSDLKGMREEMREKFDAVAQLKEDHAALKARVGTYVAVAGSVFALLLTVLGVVLARLF